MESISVKKATIAEVAIIRILVVGFQLVFLKVYTNYVSAYELGIFYFLLTSSYSLNAFLLVPLDFFQQSRLYELKIGGHSIKSFRTINAFVFKVIALLLLGGNLICYFLNPHYCYTLTVITLLAVSTYSVTLLRGIINNLEHRRKAIYCLLLEYVLKIVFFYIYVQLYTPTSLTILSSLLSASFISLIVLLTLLTTLTEFKFKEVKLFTFKEVFNFSYPMSIASIINWIQLQSYSLVLVPLGLTEVVGIYATIANVGAGGMNAYSTIFQQVFVPNIYKSKGAYLKIYLRNAVFSIVFILICSALLSKIIVGLLTRPDFVKYAAVILYGVACEGGNFLIGALTIYLTLHNITKTNIKVSLIGLFAFLASFFGLYLLHSVNIYTVGIPMVLTQIVIAGGLFMIALKNTLIADKLNV